MSALHVDSGTRRLTGNLTNQTPRIHIRVHLRLILICCSGKKGDALRIILEQTGYGWYGLDVCARMYKQLLHKLKFVSGKMMKTNGYFVMDVEI